MDRTTSHWVWERMSRVGLGLGRNRRTWTSPEDELLRSWTARETLRVTGH